MNYTAYIMHKFNLIERQAHTQSIVLQGQHNFRPEPSVLLLQHSYFVLQASPSLLHDIFVVVLPWVIHALPNMRPLLENGQRRQTAFIRSLLLWKMKVRRRRDLETYIFYRRRRQISESRSTGLHHFSRNLMAGWLFAELRVLNGGWFRATFPMKLYFFPKHLVGIFDPHQSFLQELYFITELAILLFKGLGFLLRWLISINFQPTPFDLLAFLVLYF